MKVKFDYPRPVFFDRDEEIFSDTTMFDLSFRTAICYFKNHSTDYEEFHIYLLGFGIRLFRGGLDE